MNGKNGKTNEEIIGKKTQFQINGIWYCGKIERVGKHRDTPLVFVAFEGEEGGAIEVSEELARSGIIE